MQNNWMRNMKTEVLSEKNDGTSVFTVVQTAHLLAV